MIASTMLQSKILKTKKRLSRDTRYLRSAFVGILGLIAILVFVFRVTFLSRNHGIVDAEIPVLSVPIEDSRYHRFSEEPDTAVSERTPVVILTEKAFYFGSFKAFSGDFAKKSNKYYILHKNGAPDINALVDTMGEWLHTHRGPDSEATPIIFLPIEDIPAPIVIQTIASLKTSALFDRVVLASGMI